MCGRLCGRLRVRSSLRARSSLRSRCACARRRRRCPPPPAAACRAAARTRAALTTIVSPPESLSSLLRRMSDWDMHAGDQVESERKATMQKQPMYMDEMEFPMEDEEEHELDCLEALQEEEAVRTKYDPSKDTELVIYDKDAEVVSDHSMKAELCEVSEAVAAAVAFLRCPAVLP